MSGAPWENEPDKAEWTDEATGLECTILRIGAIGHLCGYVRLPDGHPWKHKSLSGDDYHLLSVHGGCTYQGGHPNGRGDGDWIGFDCAHVGDYSPRLGSLAFDPDARYRDLAYVKAEVESMARQVAEAVA